MNWRATWTRQALCSSNGGGQGQNLAHKNLYWDFPFILAYSFCLALLVFRANEWSLHCWLPYAVVATFAALQLLAGLLDVGENLCLLKLLNGARADWLPSVARWLAIVKFSLVALGALVVVAGKGLEWLSVER